MGLRNPKIAVRETIDLITKRFPHLNKRFPHLTRE
jgi:hypothetical protein